MNEDRDVLLKGTPEERIDAWLKLTKNEDGHYKAGVRTQLTVTKKTD